MIGWEPSHGNNKAFRSYSQWWNKSFWRIHEIQLRVVGKRQTSRVTNDVSAEFRHLIQPISKILRIFVLICENGMGKPAARLGDMVLQSGPHCHAPIHPVNPVPHPPMPLAIIKGQPNVLIGKMPAARLTDMTAPCLLPGCVPGGPGMVQVGSATVLIGGLPAARVGDMTMHAACMAVLPAPTGTILPPGCPTVMIGG